MDLAALTIAVAFFIAFVAVRNRQQEKFSAEKEAIRTFFKGRTFTKEYAIEVLGNTHNRDRLKRALELLQVSGELKSAGINLLGQNIYSLH